MKPLKKQQVLENVLVETAGAEGKCVARHNDFVIFISGVVPGDVVDIRISKLKKTFAEAQVIQWHRKSDDHIEPFCQYFGLCGGCKWQNMPYDIQLKYKQQQVEDNLQRIGHLEMPESAPILPSNETQYYRNKLEFTFTDYRWVEKQDDENVDRRGLGFHKAGRFDKIIDVEHCYLQAEPSNSIRNEVRRYAKEHALDFQNPRFHKGLLRNIIIRTTSTNELMVIMVFGRLEEENIQAFMKHLETTFPITSLYYCINEKVNDSLHDQEMILFSGKGFITEEMEGLKFMIGPKSFYQTNSLQAYELYKITRDFAQLSENDIVYDLYTGTGTIANFVAKTAKHVVGIEYVEDAIEDAKKNSEINEITNTSFFAGDMRKVLTNEFVAEHGKPDVIITDPPRSGMHEDVVNVILNAAPNKVVYVSCNPATQARDLELMSHAYSVEKVQPVDMFPHTHHVENVVLLKRK